MSKAKDDDADVPQELRPIDEPPPDDEPPVDEPPPPPPPPPGGSGVTISQLTPIAGALVGGIEVTLTGTGFQPGAEVFFGSKGSPEVFVDSENTVRATLPQATEAGSVTVSLVNPDGSQARREGGFTYIATEPTNRVEVLGVSPLAVIEDTETEVTVRGRNLIAAFNEGLVALRGPTRARVTNFPPVSRRDEATGIEELTFTVRITATPPLAPLERLAIQVLASRADVMEEGIIESSRQMFTVLPRAIPVPLAFTENVAADTPALVMVAGRNLEGCSLDFGPGATVHMQASDDRAIVGIVSFQENLAKAAATPQFSILSESGSEIAQYSVSDN